MEEREWRGPSVLWVELMDGASWFKISNGQEWKGSLGIAWLTPHTQVKEWRSHWMLCGCSRSEGGQWLGPEFRSSPPLAGCNTPFTITACFYFCQLSVTLHLCVAFTQTETRHFFFRRAPSLTITWGSGDNLSYLEESVSIVMIYLYWGSRNLVSPVCLFLRKLTQLPASVVHPTHNVPTRHP